LPLSNVTFAPKSLPAGGAPAAAAPAASTTTPTSTTTPAVDKSNGSPKKKNKNKSKGGEEKKDEATEKKGEKEAGKQEGGSGDDILSALKSSAVEYYARSTFSALSGKGDRFETPEELSDSLRRGVFIDKNLIATLNCDPDSLNAYIYDFYTHKSTKALIKYNHMRRDTLYDTLKDFMLVCKALATALLARVPSSPVGAEFKQVADEFGHIFHEYGHLH